ncbi:hypothetical protein [Massilia sp. YMA4]|uniref:hypothetical protein n=1 Tax=Massilia sp. YMA4 TaxID=1593482 RepID=UPI001582EAAE|nr:hypothetical protein [Massilia sp. YMA4]
MKSFLFMGLAMASSVCMSQTTIPEMGKVLDEKPNSSESAPARTPPKTGYEKAPPSLLDDQFFWDQFKHRSTLTWACRGSTSGKVVANSYCAAQPMVDSRWPDKKTPEDYTGVLTD